MIMSFRLSVESDPCPDLPVEAGPNQDGVGKWVPEQKHTLLAKMIGGTRAARGKWGQRVLIDPFCGPGRIRVKGESFTRDGGTMIACRQATTCIVPFTSVLVGDLDSGRAEACGARLKAIGAPVKRFIGPAIETVRDMIKEVPRGALSLAYIDPYNLEYLAFSIIETLATLQNIDFAVHFSTMDLHRNVDMELDPLRARFDDAAPGWRDALGSRNLSKGSLPQEFFAYWMELVKGLGFEFSKEMPLVRGDRNEPLYRLVFFSRHPFPNKIWADVARNPNLGFDF
jgi:three-Cys-motif partner protein